MPHILLDLWEDFAECISKNWDERRQRRAQVAALMHIYNGYMPYNQQQQQQAFFPKQVGVG